MLWLHSLRTWALGCLAALFVLTSPGWAQMKIGSIERTTPALDALLDKSAAIEVLAEGFTWSEGPLWIGGAKDGHLLFSDIPRNSIFNGRRAAAFRCSCRHRVIRASPTGLEPGSNGLILDRDGRIVMCEHGDRRVSVLTKMAAR